MRTDFAYIQALQARARRERAEVMYELLIAPLVAWVRRNRNSQNNERSAHAPRAHLARQG